MRAEYDVNEHATELGARAQQEEDSLYVSSLESKERESDLKTEGWYGARSNPSSSPGKKGRKKGGKIPLNTIKGTALRGADYMVSTLLRSMQVSLNSVQPHI